MPPTAPTWLTPQFLEKILRNWKKDPTLSLIKTVTTPATEDGDNYSSDMFRVNFEYTTIQNNTKIPEKLSVIIKAALKPEGGYEEICSKIGIFDTEISMMTSTLRQMEAFLNDDKLSALCLYAQKDPTFMIIEDLIPLGFRMAARRDGLDLQHCLIAMRGLARFHAASVHVCEKDPELKVKYHKGLFSTEAPGNMVSLFNEGSRRNAEIVATWEDIDERCRDKVIQASHHAFEKAALVRQPDATEFNVINHGDFWINNMLFRYDDRGNPVDLIFVDFQYSVYASPAVDIQYFLNTSPTEDVCINYTDELINEYHRTLSEAMGNFHGEILTVEELKGSLEKLEFYGFQAASLTLPIVLKKKDEENGEDTPEYRRAMTRRLKYWDDAGFLDAFFS